VIKIKLPEWAIWVLLLVTAAGWKALLLIQNVVPFNADEAVVGLMARHILAGARPIFFYGQAYMGSLDAFWVALGFSIFGSQVWVIRLMQLLLYLATIITTVLLGRAATGSRKAGWIAGVLMALPTVNVTLYTTASLGGYGEALLIGNLILLTGMRLLRELDHGMFAWLTWAGLGFLGGLGLWTHGMTLVYLAPVGLAVLIHLLRTKGWLQTGRFWGCVAAVAAGFILGSLPWWIYAFQAGWTGLVGELFGSAVSVESGSWLERTGAHLVNLVLLGASATFGLRPPWNVTWLALPLLPFVLLFWIVVIIWMAKQARTNRVLALMIGVCLTLATVFIITSFGVDPSGRYFTPLAAPLAVGAGVFITEKLTHKWLSVGLVGLVIVFNGWGTLQCAQANPPGLTTQFDPTTVVDSRNLGELADFLHDQGEMRGFTTYWVSYPLAFISDEELIYTPRLPYHNDLRYTHRDDRIAAYDEIIGRSERLAYITAQNPTLDEALRAGLTRLQVTWKEKSLGDYRVYYHFSRCVTPEELPEIFNEP